MNNIEMEEKLFRSGFTGKDIAVMRQYLGQNGATYLTLLNELRGRFIVNAIIIFIFLLGLIYTIVFEDRPHIIGYIIMIIVVLPIINFVTPMRLAFKAYRYMK